MRAHKSLNSIDRRSGLQSPSLSGHFQIARIDHWVKNIFVLPGIVTALSLNQVPITPTLLIHVVGGLLSVCLVTSSNYVINELWMAPRSPASQ